MTKVAIIQPRTVPHEGPLTILYTGKLAKKNGVKHLLEAFQKVHEQFPRTQLKLIGDGEWKGRLELLARKLHVDEVVHFLGALTQQQVQQELAQAHLLCLPCLTDNKGNRGIIPDALKEAMASGLPDVSTYHSSIPELVTDGVNGYLVPEKNSHALADKLIRLIEQPHTWEQLGLAARENIEAGFSQEKQVGQLELWFDQIIQDYQEKRNRPFFTVIIPAFNRERFIGKAIRSVLRQTCDDFEIIVVDDGSTDRTKKAVKAFGDRVKYIYQKNQGPSAARNTGILHAKGEYIAFLDSDDCFFPSKLEANKRFLEKHPECKFLYSWYYEKRDGVRKRRIQKTKSYKDLQKFRSRLYQRAFTIRTSTAVIHRCCFDKIGLFGKKYRYSQDWDMWLRLAKYFLGYCQKVSLVQYRRHKRVKNPVQARGYHEQIRKTARRLYRWNAKKLNRLKKKYG